VRSPAIEAEVARYYTDRVAVHGADPRGVDWNSAESQRLRFAQLLKVVEPDAAFSLTDYGCGYGALRDEIGDASGLVRYQGFDIAPAMVELARRRHAGRPDCTFTAEPAELTATGYVVASGIFNVRLGTPEDAWRDYTLATLEHLAGLATVGFAFNMLSTYSDADRRRPDLYYADPAYFFDHVKRRLAAHVSLLHDYPLWEFTILARK
jgi:SAM-dependent methyltransferase